MSKASLLKTAAFLIPLAGLLYFGITEDPYRPVESGEPAPDFSLPSLAGGSVELAQFQGKLVVLNFWATWCPPCVEEMPSLERLSRQGAERNLEVVTVSVDQDLSVLHHERGERATPPRPRALGRQTKRLPHEPVDLRILHLPALAFMGPSYRCSSFPAAPQ